MNAASSPLLLAVLLLLVLTLAGFLWARRGGKATGRAAASSSASVGAVKVTLPEESGAGERGKRRRTGENQELRHRTVHGPYRPIGNLGEPSDVRPGDER